LRISLSFQAPFPAEAPRERLVVFHHAGGSSLSFLKLAKQLSGAYDVWLAELPGRGIRHQESPPVSLRDYARAAAREIPGDLPVTLYGHSMGAGLAYEAALMLEEEEKPLKRVVVSCCRPPAAGHGPTLLRDRPYENWTDEDLLRAMAAYGPIPAALREPAGRAYFLPLFRLDLTLIREYQSLALPLRAPILAVAGRGDAEVRPAVMQGWREYTEGTFQLLTEEGGHFCVLERPAFLSGLFERLAAASVVA
jgi:surfactin synthase thioesterase subunit